MNWIYLGIGIAMGAVAMFFYLQRAGLFRTHGEHLLAQKLGDEQMNYFCEEAAK